MTKSENDIGSTIGGFILMIIVGAYFYFTAEDTNIPWIENNSTLKTYKEKTKEERTNIIKNTLNKNGWKFGNNAKDYINCMGDFAYHKNEDLKYTEVIKWCFNEENNNKEKFISHYNQLDEKDLSVEAFVLCKNIVQEKLLSPTTADFPLLDRQTWAKGHQSYKIRSYVDSQNQNGAIIRTNWNCYMKYKGSGDAYSPLNWKSELEFF